jgi:hypothetical protein
VLLLLAQPVRAGAFEQAVAATETARGLRFLKLPVLASAGDDRLASLAVAARRREPVPEEATGTPSCLPDVDRTEVVCAKSPDDAAVRLALARLLDTQHYP